MASLRQIIGGLVALSGLGHLVLVPYNTDMRIQMFIGGCMYLVLASFIIRKNIKALLSTGIILVTATIGTFLNFQSMAYSPKVILSFSLLNIIILLLIFIYFRKKLKLPLN